TNMENIDVVVIGAGISGLTFAKTYLEIHPNSTSITILESSTSLGGTWACDRLYPALKTNNQLGTYESPDFAMDPEVFGVKAREHMPGTVVYEYLEAFARRFDVLERIRFGWKVEEVSEDGDGGWVINVEGEKNIRAKKLVLATGLTGNPNMPSIPEAAEFGGPVYHAKDFVQHKDLLHTAKKVAVYGASKSGWDAVYAYASAGVRVEWVIRETGRGPCWMTPSWVMGGRVWIEKLVMTRILTWFGPTIWGADDGYGFWKRLLHQTVLGRFVVRKFWGLLEKDILGINGFDSHPEMKKLKPWSGSFWSGTSLSNHNYPTDFYDYVTNGLVKVYHGDITNLSPHTVHLSSGEALKIDALHCSTGWKHEPAIKFIPPSLATELGLPCSGNPVDEKTTAKADAEILSRLPILRDQPNVRPKGDAKNTPTEDNATPYRLYRHMIPPARAQSRNFAIACALLSYSQFIAAQIQALWVIAYFDSKLPLTRTAEEMSYEAELCQRFGRWRYAGGGGENVPNFVFESLPYFDELLGDLGL
ncbi:FAD-dependent monooxygenase DEP4, partial [Lachnellula suecica]